MFQRLSTIQIPLYCGHGQSHTLQEDLMQLLVEHFYPHWCSIYGHKSGLFKVPCVGISYSSSLDCSTWKETRWHQVLLPLLSFSPVPSYLYTNWTSSFYFIFCHIQGWWSFNQVSCFIPCFKYINSVSPFPCDILSTHHWIAQGQ